MKSKRKETKVAAKQAQAPKEAEKKPAQQAPESKSSSCCG
jgi:hypothetical protein